MSKEKGLTVGVILAAGSGRRFGNDGQSKQFYRLSGRPCVEYAIDAFVNCQSIDIVIVVLPDNCGYQLSTSHRIHGCLGGATRFDSSWNAICYVHNNFPQCKKILFHDGCRPLVSQTTIDECVSALDHYSAVDVAIKSSDTIIHSEDNKFIKDVPIRSQYLRGQTPQGFHFNLIYKAFAKAVRENQSGFTDDCSVFLRNFPEKKVYLQQGSAKNLKITYPIDLATAELLIQQPLFQKTSELNTEQLRGKKVLLIGGSRGIGAEIFKLCAAANAEIHEYSRSSTGYDLSKLQTIYDLLDMWREKQIKFDHVFITAGILYRESFTKQSDKNILEMVAVNFSHQLLLLRELPKFMPESGGSIVLFTSSSYTRGRPLTTVYSAVKAAIANFTQGYSQELLSHNIRLNCLCPQRTLTDMRLENFHGEDANDLLSPKLAI